MWAEGGRPPAGADSLCAVKDRWQEAAGIGGCGLGTRFTKADMTSRLALCQTVGDVCPALVRTGNSGLRSGY